MKKYAILIGDRNEDLCREVQEKLFSLGFKWMTTGREIWGLDKKVLFLNYGGGIGNITYGSQTESEANYRDWQDCVVLWPREVLEDRIELEGADKPVKEMTVAEISKSLGYEVKVVKD